MATHAINTGHEFLNITNMKLIKHIPHKGTIMNIWENLQIYKSNLATHAINTGHEFLNITNMKLIKHNINHVCKYNYTIKSGTINIHRYALHNAIKTHTHA